MTKKRNQKSHFRRRVFERYNITINEGEYDFLVSLIQKHQTTFLFKQSNRVSIHSVQYKNQVLVVVYDKQRQSLVTALPGHCTDISAIQTFVLEFDDPN